MRHSRIKPSIFAILLASLLLTVSQISASQADSPTHSLSLQDAPPGTFETPIPSLQIPHTGSPEYYQVTLFNTTVHTVIIDLTDSHTTFGIMTADGATPPCCDTWSQGTWTDNQTHLKTVPQMWNSSQFPNKVAAVNGDYFVDPGNGAPLGEFTRWHTPSGRVRQYQYNGDFAAMIVKDWDGARYPVLFRVSRQGVDSGTKLVMGGGPIIKIVNGQVQYNPSDERTHLAPPSGRGANDRRGRTAACVDQDTWHLYLLAVWKPFPNSGQGLTGLEMGEVMKAWGCERGMEFDGGPSTTMVFRGNVKIENWPGPGARPIGGSFLVGYN